MYDDLNPIFDRWKDIQLGVVVDATSSICTDIVVGTPVDTGDLRKSWTPALNSFNESNGGGDFKSVLKLAKPTDFFTFTSALPYSRPIEYGHSAQAPSGMLRINAAKWPNKVSAAVSKARR